MNEPEPMEPPPDTSWIEMVEMSDIPSTGLIYAPLILLVMLFAIAVVIALAVNW